MSAERMKDKLAADFNFVVTQKSQVDKLGVPRIRSVLIETLDRHHADYLSKLAAEPDVCGPKPTSLFWFTPSELLVKPVEMGGKEAPLFLYRPEIIFDKRFATPVGDSLCSLLD